ncbi:MAG: hypothetical protein CL521_05900 [Actinobacteria bacterium]|nr:hypothetical protein [Actinomycetota bacterium]
MNSLILIIDLLTLLFPQKIATQLSKHIATIFLKLNPQYTLRLMASVKAAFPALDHSKVKEIVFNSQRNHISFFSTYRFLALASLKRVKPILNEVDIVGKEHINLLTQLNKPVLIVSIHMGDFFKGFLKLATLAPKSKTIGLIKWMNSSKKEEAAYQKFIDLGANLKLFRLRDKPGMDAVKFLRKGNILLTMCDVSPQIVKTTSVSFFNQEAEFPCGPSELAIASQAIILPIYFTKSNGRDTLNICPPIDTSSIWKQKGSLSSKSKKITQQLAKLVENWIRIYPDEWHFWVIMEELWKTKK